MRIWESSKTMKHHVIDRLHQNKFKFLYVILPLILLTLGLNNDAFAIDMDLECPEEKVKIIRTTNPDPICVAPDTAQRWVGMGIAEYAELAFQVTIGTELPEEIIEPETIEEPAEPEMPDDNIENTLPEILGGFASTILSYEYENVPDDLSRAQSYLVTFSNGDFAESLTVQTFAKVEPGDGPHIIPSFYEEGLDTYFVLQSVPSTDKTEFYNLVADTINPGKAPELFDVSIDVLAGDNSVIITTHYAKCKVTDYLPYTQDVLLFYQFADMIGKEIRDSTTIYCNGIDLEVYNEESQKVISDEQLPYHPISDQSIAGYVAHFSGPDFDGLNTITTFSDFSPSVDFIETPFDTLTIPGNTLGSKPQFFLESLPSIDKMELYEYYAMHVNPGQPPKPVDVSIDLITGDGTILQRWNYIDCTFYDHSTFLEDSFLKYPYAEKLQPEIRDKSEFTCAGNNIEIHGNDLIPKFPIIDPTNADDDSDIFPAIAELDDRSVSLEFLRMMANSKRFILQIIYKNLNQ